MWYVNIFSPGRIRNLQFQYTFLPFCFPPVIKLLAWFSNPKESDPVLSPGSLSKFKPNIYVWFKTFVKQLEKLGIMT